MGLFGFVEGARVLVIGATGRVGRVLSPHIANARPATLALTGTHDTTGNVFDAVSKFDYCQVRLPDDIPSLDTDFDYVIVLAGITKPQVANNDPYRAIMLNVESVRRVFEQFAPTKARIVVASTVSSSALNSAYAGTKIALENLVVGFSREANPHVTVVRLGNVLKSSGVIVALLKSLSAAGQAQVHSSTEFFQPTHTIPYTFDLALQPEVLAGDIFTHLMYPMPIPFLAGLLAGAHMNTVTQEWNPSYERTTTNPPYLLPEWWWPYSQFVTINREPTDVPESVRPEDKTVVFLKTNFRRRSDVDEAERVRRRLENQRNAEFGMFAQWLKNEGLLSTR